MIRRTLLPFLRNYLILLLCVIILTIPLYIGTIFLFEKRQLAITSEGMKGDIYRLDQQVASLSSIAYSLGNDSMLRSYATRALEDLKPSDFYTISKLQHDFQRLYLAQPYITDYGLMLRNGILFTGERLHFPDEQYYKRYIQFGEMEQQDLFDAFMKAPTPSLFLGEMNIIMMQNIPEITRSYRGTIWLCSLSKTLRKSPIGVFYATLSQNTLAQLFLRDLDEEYAGFVLLNSQGEELMRYGLTPEPDSTHDMHEIHASAKQTGLNVTLFLSPSLFFDMMTPIRNLLIFFLCGLLLFGVLLSAGLAWRSSRPVRHLLSLLDQSKDCSGSETDDRNSYEVIGNAVTSLLSSVDAYRDALEAQRIRLSENVFDTLLRTTFIYENSASQQRMQEFKHFFPLFPASYRLSIISLYCDGANAETLPQMRILLSNLIEAEMSPVPYVHFTGWKAVLVLDTTTHVDWQERLVALRRAIYERIGISLTIILSESGSSIEQLSTLYRQTKDILNFVKRMPPVHEVDVWQKQHFPYQRPALPLFYTDMTQLYNLVCNGEKEDALALLGRICELLQPSSIHEEMVVKRVYADLYNLIMRLRVESNNVASVPELPVWHEEIELSIMFSEMQRCVTALCDLYAARQETFPASVCRFIDEHLSDSALSTVMVADHFSISQPTLQKIIRKEKGCSFYDYVAQKRYEMAVQLLTQTDIPINSIVVQCGYNSVNSFYKAFKRIGDTSPANVRRNAYLGMQIDANNI